MHAPHLIERNPPSSSLLNERQNAPDATEHGNGAEHEEHKDGLEWTELIRIAFVALAAAAYGSGFGSHFRASV